MEKTEIINLVISSLEEIFEHEDQQVVFSEQTNLLGENGVIDSMKLVELCLALEDKLFEKNIEFDWQSESAMSKSRSMFISVESLSNEILNQYINQK